jgi:unsaturated rhamnogalacturonyl hydrolase
MKPAVAVCAAILWAAQPALAQKNFGDWPAGKSPREIGKRVAEHFVPSAHLQAGAIIYPEVCAWYGVLTFARLSGDKDLTRRLIARFEPVSTEPDVYQSVLGVVPLEIYLETKDKQYLEMGQRIADRQWENSTPEGLTAEAHFWIDDIYMITALQVQAFRATGDHKYLDRAALEMTAYIARLQQPSGLFYHAPDVPLYWGRGNGWAAVALAELLRWLPKDHPKRATILVSYLKMMDTLVKVRDKDGMWKQLLDHPEAWPETSGTGMLTFAMITGVKNGWLDEKTYGPVARRAWLALITYINADGDIRNVCEATYKLNDAQYYLDRKRLTGDLHGQAPILWCASALLR